jgi:hypothetical protein
MCTEAHTRYLDPHTQRKKRARELSQDQLLPHSISLLRGAADELHRQGDHLKVRTPYSFADLDKNAWPSRTAT